MTDQAQRRTLDEIEQRIASHRAAYLVATWKAENTRLPADVRAEALTEANMHESESNLLLGQWDAVRRGVVLS